MGKGKGSWGQFGAKYDQKHGHHFSVSPPLNVMNSFKLTECPLIKDSHINFINKNVTDT